MKLARWWLPAALGLAWQVARADPPVDGATLGQLEAVLEYCAHLDPALAERNKVLAQGLTGRATDDELAKVRAGATYRAAYDATRAELARQPKDDADKACLERSQSSAQ